ncbi:MAG: D-alanyl-D-alanine carboxypeptidase [Clostridia bacterium]|nr:D-alanyl-D-alanine carboxypeptidase [Clostridia bacterium]
MKQRLAAFLILFSVVFSGHAYAALKIEAPNAILIDADTGLTLYEKDADKKVYPASTTKIVTAIIALENENGDEVLTASDAAVNGIDYDSSKIYLKVGEQMSYKDLIYALMVESANDAAVVLAEHISGSEEAFVELMNQKVQEIGAENTHFTNVHGLHDEEHYTTAADMAKIARYAMNVPGFAEIAATKKYTIPPTNMTESERTLTNRNELLNSSKKYYYEPATGIKTGHTSKAGYCLVSSAEKDGKHLIAAVFGDKETETDTYSFVDSKKLLSYGINDLESKTLAKKGDIVGEAPIKNSYADKAILQTAGEIKAILPEGADENSVQTNTVLKENLKAPIKAGSVLGYIEYSYKGQTLGKTNLLAVSDYKKIPLAFIFKPIYKLFKSKTLYIILGILVLLYIILYRISESQKRRKRRKRRREELHKRQG